MKEELLELLRCADVNLGALAGDKGGMASIIAAQMQVKESIAIVEKMEADGP